ncbi:MAG: CDP-glycerol glycerophosphotransferase family protein [Lachnospiraceae bacterium]|nr:CDP-glycerol glycerophosphotransferase family protein [Lachnospiraceae bacterium]
MNKFLVEVILPLWYRLCCISRVKNNILFIVVRGDKLSSDFVVIKRHLKKDEDLKKYKREYHYLTLGRGTRLKYLNRSFSLMPKLARAKYVFMSDGSNIVGALKLRKGTHLIQTWHGCGALKKFGKDTKDEKVYFGNEDIVTVSSKKVVSTFSKAMGIEENVVCPIGIPHTDMYYSKSFMNHCDELKKQLLGGRNKNIILYAPTFRGDISNPQDASGLNLDLMYKHLNEDYIVISKLHPLLRPVKKSYRHRDFYYDVGNVWSIEEALVVSDILITDYAAVIFDYTLLNKPIVLYAYDLEEYENKVGFYLDYTEEMPGGICNSTMGVIKEIKNGSHDVSKMRLFKEKYMDACDGNTTERLIKRIKAME